MRENKFEKQVRAKMDQLGFNPSDAVWAGVNKEINKKEKDRRLLFWILLFTGLVLTCGGYLYTAKKDVNLSSQSKPPSGGDKSKGSFPNDAPIVKTKLPDDKNPSGFRRVKSGSKKTNFAGGELSSGSATAINVDVEGNSITEENNDTNQGIDSITGKENKVVLAKAVDVPVKDSGVSKKGKQPPESSPWKIGFSGSAGFSNISQSDFKPASVANVRYYADPLSGAMGGTPPPATHKSSVISAGFSFGIGVFVRRNFSGRFSFSAGIDYRYYSTRIQTGIQVNSPLFLNNSVLMSGVNGYYRNGSAQTYTNQYHFVELPLMVDFQINKSRKRPFYWELGISPSWLLGSSSLQFDPRTNVYYEDSQAFNKFQLNSGTALLMGFNLRGSEFRVGPQFQYGLTPLMKTSTGNPQHLLYGGLKISFVPGKK